MEWFFYIFRNTLRFEGRARRREFGWFILIAVLIYLVGDLLNYIALSQDMDIIASIIDATYMVIGFVLWLMFISVTSRRLHDFGWSGWWQLLPVGCVILLQTVNLLGKFLNIDLGIVTEFGGMLLILIYVVFIVLLIWVDGDRFTNKYGPDPKSYIQLTSNEEDT